MLLPADVVLLMRPWGVTARERFPEFRFTQNQMLGPIFEYYSWRHQARERIRSGEIPLWNPLELSGNVLLGNSQSAVLYPPNLLLYVLPLWVGVNLVTLLHTLATGLLMLGLLRALRLSPVAALSGSLAWMLCGPLLVWTEFQTPTAALCWLPGALWAWEWAAQRRRWALGCILTAVALALTLTAGHPQFAFYVVLTTLVYALWRAPRVALIAAPTAVILAFCLSAATILPVAEASRINHRAARSDFASSVKLRLPPSYLAGLVLPNVLGNPRDYVQVVDGEPRPGHGYAGAFDYIEYCHYVGIAALILALLGIASALKQTPARFLCLVGLTGLALALGTWIGAVFYFAVPGYAQFHAPARAVSLIAFALCGLTGFGVAAIEQSAISRRQVAYAAAACAVIAVASWPLMALAYPGIASAEWLFYEAAGIRHAVLFAAATGLLAAWALAPGVSDPASPPPNDRHRRTVRPVTGSVERRRQVCLIGLPLLCALDLLIWGAGFNPATDPEMLEGPTAVGDALRSAQPGRALSLETEGLGIKGLIVANYNAVVGYREVQGADSVHSRRYHLALAAASERMSSRRPAFPEANTVRLPGADHPILDVLNVTYVTTSPPTTLPPDRFVRETDAELTVWRNPRACGPAWLVSDVVPVAGPVEAVRAMEAAEFDVRRQATVEARVSEGRERWAENGERSDAAEGAVRATHLVPHRCVYEVDSPRPQLLVTAEPAYPGWTAHVTVGGESRRAEVVVADGVLRAVNAPAGKSVVEFDYTPGTFFVGLYVTCLAVGCSVGASLALRRSNTPG